MIDPTQASQATELMRQAATSRGVSGKLSIDANPKEGFLRLKLVDIANFDPAQLINAFTYVLSEACKSFNLEVKTHIQQGE